MRSRINLRRCIAGSSYASSSYVNRFHPPPANLKITPPEIKAGSTTRERFAQHDKDPYCAGCHHLMDPIGFGFEHFDGIGLWRDTDQGLPVDASGQITDSTDANGKFDGVIQLNQLLAKS